MANDDLDFGRELVAARDIARRLAGGVHQAQAGRFQANLLRLLEGLVEKWDRRGAAAERPEEETPAPLEDKRPSELEEAALPLPEAELPAAAGEGTSSRRRK